MSNPELAYVTPKLVKWAIEQSNIPFEKIQKKLKVGIDEILAWQTGASYPPFQKAEDLADFLNIPFGFLFLENPPDTKVPLPDLRTISGKPIIKPSPEFQAVLNSALFRQEWYREYAIDQGLKELPFISSMSQQDGVDAVADRIRKALKIDEDLRTKVERWSAYLNLITAHAEALGVLVMRSGLVGNDTRRKLSPEEFQGFAISDSLAPVVFINGRDYIRAQIFTLAHELTHLWVGQSGVCTSDEAHVQQEPQVEEFCDAVAAEILVPKSDFIRDWKSNPDINRLARKYWVSSFVTLRRALETKQISHDEFSRQYKEESAKRAVIRKGKGGRYYDNVASRHSRRLAGAVVRDVREGGTVFRDGAKLLHLKLPTFARFMERI